MVKSKPQGESNQDMNVQEVAQPTNPPATPTIAEQIHELEGKLSSLQEELYIKVLTIIGIDIDDPDNYPIDDLKTDDYDNSLELLGCSNTLKLTEEQINNILKLGFDRFWVNHFDGTQQYYKSSSKHD